jgi:hypothetical protein
MQIAPVRRVSRRETHDFLARHIQRQEPVIIADLYDGDPISEIDTTAKLRDRRGDILRLVGPSYYDTLIPVVPEAEAPQPAYLIALRRYLGQSQRLLSARALVPKPRIIFFDEATSALDNRAQAVVTESLDRLDATRVVIAHRLSTLGRRRPHHLSRWRPNPGTGDLPAVDGERRTVRAIGPATDGLTSGDRRARGGRRRIAHCAHRIRTRMSAAPRTPLHARSAAAYRKSAVSIIRDPDSRSRPISRATTRP